MKSKVKHLPGIGTRISPDLVGWYWPELVRTIYLLPGVGDFLRNGLGFISIFLTVCR